LGLERRKADIPLREQLTDTACKDSRVQYFCELLPFGMSDLERESRATADL
jgi:hypothetical protein